MLGGMGKYGKAAGGSLIVEESPFSPSFIAERQKLDVHAKGLDVGSGSPTTVQRDGLMKGASFDPPGEIDGKPSEVLDRLLDRQKRAPLPVLYGQHPGEIEAGPRIRAGVSEVLDEGNEVVVLFSAVNPSSHAIEILPPQVQLGGKLKKKWTTAEQLRVIDFRLSTRRLGARQRTDRRVIFH